MERERIVLVVWTLRSLRQSRLFPILENSADGYLCS